MHGRFDNFIAVHSLSFPFECMAAVTGLIFAGVPEKFPKLRIAALEACCGWVPFLMDRLDEEFEKRGAREAPLLKRKPSEYMSGEQFFYAFELEESTVPYVIDRIGADKLLYSSDYPHWDSSWPKTVRMFQEREDISDADKRQIAWENHRTSTGLKQRLELPVCSTGLGFELIRVITSFPPDYELCIFRRSGLISTDGQMERCGA